MKTTTTKIATTFTAAIKAGAKGIVTVISAVEASRLGWRHVVCAGNPVVVGQPQRWLVPGLAPLNASAASACMCRPFADAMRGRDRSYLLPTCLLAAL